MPLSFWLLWKIFSLRVPWSLSILLAWDESLYISSGEGSAVTPLPHSLMLPCGLLVFWPQKAHATPDVMSLCPSVTAEQSLLEPSHPQDEAEEELPDGLDESFSREEDEDSEWGGLCSVPRGGECGGRLGAGGEHSCPPVLHSCCHFRMT